jgi:hypothetical protein
VASGYDVRCSVIVVRNHAVLPVHRTRSGLGDWMRPGTLMAEDTLPGPILVTGRVG